MVLQNYVVLQTGVPARMHFVEHEIVVKNITDPRTGRVKPVNTLVFRVDELNGREVVGYYSVVSEKHAQDFAPWLPASKYMDYDFIITRTGEGFQTEYTVQPVLRTR